ncbi:MAG: Asp23/Gls24 family envelope stress response protein [Candidatus Bipolaricaulaceae bacterium]
MPEVKAEKQLPLGRMTIRPEVLAAIVGKTVDQMEGVKLWHPKGFMGVFGGEAGVELTSPEPGAIDVNLKIAVMYGYPLYEVAQGVQQAVREALEGLAGVRVREVHVYVQEVFLPEVEGGENDKA